MDIPIEMEKFKLKQQLDIFGSALVSKLQTEGYSLKEDSIDVLQLLVDDNSTCHFKLLLRGNNFWDSPMLWGTSDQDSSVFYTTFLALLWQSGQLKQVPFDPIDLRIASNSKQTDDEDHEDQATPFCWENAVKNSKDWDEALSEEENDSLIGPLEIDLRRKDLYHSLFDTCRKSCERRQRHFLNSKHILKVRKLCGIQVWDYGFKFNRAVLEKTAGSLEDLSLDELQNAKELELLEDINMPKLRRLTLWLRTVDENTEQPPFVFPSPQENHFGLQYLRVHLPRPAFKSLVDGHANTLLELHLKVGTPHKEWDMWPNSCQDLHKLLSGCKGKLRRLVLVRDGYQHTRASCQDQVGALKQNLTGLTVVCEYCSSK